LHRLISRGEWPFNSWTVRISYPASSRWVANE
jgi:hypothetical protein